MVSTVRPRVLDSKSPNWKLALLSKLFLDSKFGLTKKNHLQHRPSQTITVAFLSVTLKIYRKNKVLYTLVAISLFRDEILKRDHSNKCLPLLFYGAACSLRCTKKTKLKKEELIALQNLPYGTNLLSSRFSLFTHMDLKKRRNLIHENNPTRGSSNLSSNLNFIL